MAPGLGTVGSSANTPKGVRKRDIASYLLLPKVLPRISDLFFTGFQFFAFFMAQVYRGVRLLPAEHPSLNPANIGQYGVRDIIGEAARHLVWKRENIDQIIVFIAILLGLVLLVLQAGTFLLAFAIPHAEAAANTGFSAIFGTPSWGGSQDIAFILLDRVFGVKGIFNSCVSLPNTPCSGVAPGSLEFGGTDIYKPAVFPWPYHDGLHALFQFYSIGLLLVGVFILLYFVIVIVAETAQTGTPFGKRFNTVWAPIRLVMAFGLLIPITSGLNSAQFITLYAAKWGSNFATNGWIVFNTAIQDKVINMTQGSGLAVKPKEQDPTELLNFMTLAHTCKVFEETVTRETPVDQGKADQKCDAEAEGTKIEAYIVKPSFTSKDGRMLLRGASYDDALKFSENGDIKIRFGDLSCKKDVSMSGSVEPVCGEITLPVNSLTDTGAKTIQTGYFNLVKYLWGGYGSGKEGDIKTYTNPNTGRAEQNACVSKAYEDVLKSGSGDRTIRQNALSYFQNGVVGPRRGQCNDTQYKDYTLLPFPDAGWMASAAQSYMYGDEKNKEETGIDVVTGADSAYNIPTQYIIRNILKAGVRAVRDGANAGDYNVSPNNLRRGWAVAGIWYNKIAEINGALIGSAYAIPKPTRMPQTMNAVAEQKKQSNVQTSPKDMFCPTIANGSMTVPGGDKGVDYAQTACQIMNKWAESSDKQSTGNAMSDFIKMLFGIEGLFDLRYQENNRAHPLAMLVGVGKGLIEASIRNLSLGAGSGVAAFLMAGATGGQAAPEFLNAVGSFFFSIATITLTAGFILFYVIPFLPFLYFFFAVGNWLKGVFEAMVGVPLWALAHIRIDGNGLPGEAAMNGYFMLFEIFLRPILIVFGFLASITIFAAMATVLHEVFKDAVDNLTGAGTNKGSGNAIDTFFYTVMYAVIMYIMALSSFKLIDLIPNQIMRWMGTSVSTFSDMNTDPAGNLTQMTAIAGTGMVQSMTGGFSQFMGSATKGAGALNQAAQNAGKTT